MGKDVESMCKISRTLGCMAIAAERCGLSAGAGGDAMIENLEQAGRDLERIGEVLESDPDFVKGGKKVVDELKKRKTDAAGKVKNALELVKHKKDKITYVASNWRGVVQLAMATIKGSNKFINNLFENSKGGSYCVGDGVKAVGLGSLEGCKLLELPLGIKNNNECDAIDVPSTDPQKGSPNGVSCPFTTPKDTGISGGPFLFVKDADGGVDVSWTVNQKDGDIMKTKNLFYALKEAHNEAHDALKAAKDAEEEVGRLRGQMQSRVTSFSLTSSFAVLVWLLIEII
ncbi:hypothetical protein TRVL_08495 [Trypanosoma vivax]|nr:hypothetical protein TRVL_08495 [Trypanosoma vivax]